MEEAEDPKEYHSRTERLIEEVALSDSVDRPRIEKVWDEFSVAFSVTPEWAHSGVGQLMLISGVNLVGRFCRKLTFQKSLSDVKRIVPFPLIGVGGTFSRAVLKLHVLLTLLWRPEWSIHHKTWVSA